MKLRRRWSRRVRSPAFAALGGSLMEEEYIEGRAFRDLDSTAQMDVVRHVFRSYADLVATEAEGSSQALVERLLQPQVLAQLPDALSQRLGYFSAEPHMRPSSWPLVPTVEDAHWNNVIVIDEAHPVFVYSSTASPWQLCRSSPHRYR